MIMIYGGGRMGAGGGKLYQRRGDVKTLQKLEHFHGSLYFKVVYSVTVFIL